MTNAVQFTREFARVRLLPRRVWQESEQFAGELSRILRKPGGTMTLRPVQAQAFLDLDSQRGAFLSVRVGGGKTLISLLAPYILGARRPLLLLPAKLIEKTRREQFQLAHHWPIPNFIRIESYELLGRVQAAELLNRYQPDLIVADEAHKLKNPKAAVTKRVSRYMKEHPETEFVAMSGTITRKSLRDYAHILTWCLRGRAPVPMVWSELEAWADVLDHKEESRTQPGALMAFCSDEEKTRANQREAARNGFRRRLVESPGVVATSDKFLGSSLVISKHKVQLPKVCKDALDHLREAWETPDGQPLAMPTEIWRHSREIALGFYYRWDPYPPQDWLMARKLWAATCREILSDNRRNLDSEAQVANAVDAGYYPWATSALSDWRRIKGTFEPNTVPVWLTNDIVEAVARWGRDNGGIIWTEHKGFSRALAKATGWRYYGARGLDDSGRYIEDADADYPVIASVASNKEGRNLQFKWSRNLVTSCPVDALEFEQLLGRTHRDGQEREDVGADILVTDQCHEEFFRKALASAHFVKSTTGQEQKLLYCDLVWEGL